MFLLLSYYRPIIVSMEITGKKIIITHPDWPLFKYHCTTADTASLLSVSYGASNLTYCIILCIVKTFSTGHLVCNNYSGKEEPNLIGRSKNVRYNIRDLSVLVSFVQNATVCGLPYCSYVVFIFCSSAKCC